MNQECTSTFPPQSQHESILSNTSLDPRDHEIESNQEFPNKGFLETPSVLPGDFLMFKKIHRESARGKAAKNCILMVFYSSGILPSWGWYRGGDEKNINFENYLEKVILYVQVGCSGYMEPQIPVTRTITNVTQKSLRRKY